MNIQKSEGTDNFEQESDAAPNPFADPILDRLRVESSKDLWKQKLVQIFQGKPLAIRYVGSYEYIEDCLSRCPPNTKEHLLQALEELIENWDVLSEKNWDLVIVLEVIREYRPLAGFDKVVELLKHDALLIAVDEGCDGNHTLWGAVNCLQRYHTSRDPEQKYQFVLPRVATFCLTKYREILECHIDHSIIGKEVRGLLKKLEDN